MACALASIDSWMTVLSSPWCEGDELGTKIVGALDACLIRRLSACCILLQVIGGGALGVVGWAANMK